MVPAGGAEEKGWAGWIRSFILRPGEDFFNYHNHDFVRVAVAVPLVRVADPEFNVGRTIELIERAAELQAGLVLFPELGLSAYSCEDLFHQKALLDSALAAFFELEMFDGVGYKYFVAVNSGVL